MNKLITYLKEGKGRGLLAMLIFSALITLLLWWSSYSSLKMIPSSFPNISESNMFWVHLGFLLTCMGLTWILYLLVVGLTSFLGWVFRLKLPKGTIWRSATFSIITFVLLGVLSSMISALLLLILGAILPYQESVEYMIIISGLNPIIFLLIFFTLLVMLILCGIREPKEKKKK